MIEVFYIGQGDTLPAYPFVVRDKDGVKNLSAVQSVYFIMTRISTASVVASVLASVIVDASTGEGQYNWAVADTAQTGDFAVTFLFVQADGSFSLPRNEIAKVVVESRYPSVS